eukprot:8969523-Heterocapsa_arctica.AAC.1
MIILGSRCGGLGGADTDSEASSTAGTPNTGALSPTSMAIPTEATTALLVGATNASQEMARQQSQFEDKVLNLPVKAQIPAASTPTVQVPAGAEGDRADLRRLQGRTDAFEMVMMDESGRNAVATGSSGDRAPAIVRRTPVLAWTPLGGLDTVPVLAALPVAAEGVRLADEPPVLPTTSRAS